MRYRLRAVGLAIGQLSYCCGVAAATAASGAVPNARTTRETISGDAVINGGYSGGGGGVSGCDYIPAASTLAEHPSGERTLIGGVQYRYYSELCNGEFTRAVWIRDYDPAEVLLEASDRVERQLPEPTPLMIWPDPDYDWAYAQVPIDYRADPSEWQRFEATATATTPVETVSVTIRAEPAQLVFASGDRNGTIAGAACGGDGPLAGYNPDVPGECSYTYINASSTASNARSFPASIAISWDINYWSTTDPGFSGTLAPIIRETLFPMEVAEVKILSVNNPAG